VPELNLERKNKAGISYRAVMSNFFLEAEGCLRQGIAFDAMWRLPEQRYSNYRVVVHIREDGKVEIVRGERREILPAARAVPAKEGEAPGLTVQINGTTAMARVTETTAPIFYTHGTDTEGVYRNAMVLWELFGPGEEEYAVIVPEGMRPTVRRNGSMAEVQIRLPIRRSGRYRLRAATVDTAGRRRVIWTPLNVTERNGQLAIE
jgi:hypothetical protein